jgi:hypothetical protein
MYIFKYLTLLLPHYDPVCDLRIAFEAKACCFRYETAVILSATEDGSLRSLWSAQDLFRGLVLADQLGDDLILRAALRQLRATLKDVEIILHSNVFSIAVLSDSSRVSAVATMQ